MHTLARPLLLAVALTACHGEASLDAAPPDAHPSDAPTDAPSEAATDAPAEPPAVDLRFDGGFVRKAFPRADGGFVVLVEPPMDLHVDQGFPRREVRWLGADGREDRPRRAPKTDEQLLDAAVHPSGAVSILFASDAGYRVVRLARDGFEWSHAVVDPAVATDPPALPPGAASGPIETHSHDTGRVAAHGEDLVLAGRTARHSVVVYWLRPAAASDLRIVHRAMAFPAASMAPLGLTGGSFDTFGQVNAQYAVHLDVDQGGRVYVGVRYPDLSHHRYPQAIAKVFGEPIVGDEDGLDSYVARLAPDGARLGTSVITTDKPDEIYGLAADQDGVWVLGRNELWSSSGNGHDALVARVTSGGKVTVRELHVAEGDIAFDAAPAADGGVIVVGASGYFQNPSGASISEASSIFARWLRADGSAVDLVVPVGPRHNEGRFVRWVGDRLLVGGMLDGPGTHSADSDRSLLRARGFLSQVALPRR